MFLLLTFLAFICKTIIKYLKNTFDKLFYNKSIMFVLKSIIQIIYLIETFLLILFENKLTESCCKQLFMSDI